LLRISSTLKLSSKSCIKVEISCGLPTMLVLHFLEVLQPMEDRCNNFLSLFNLDNKNMAFFVHNLLLYTQGILFVSCLSICLVFFFFILSLSLSFLFVLLQVSSFPYYALQRR
jgi:hypothetical protein